MFAVLLVAAAGVLRIIVGPSSAGWQGILYGLAALSVFEFMIRWGRRRPGRLLPGTASRILERHRSELEPELRNRLDRLGKPW